MKEKDIRPEGDVQNGKDIDAEIGSTATMTCLFVTASAMALVAMILRAGNPGGTSLTQILSGIFQYAAFPVFAFLATRNILKYVRLLHDRSRSAGNHRSE